MVEVTVAAFKGRHKAQQDHCMKDTGMVIVLYQLTLDWSLYMYKNTSKNKRTSENQDIQYD